MYIYNENVYRFYVQRTIKGRPYICIPGTHSVNVFSFKTLVGISSYSIAGKKFKFCHGSPKAHSENKVMHNNLHNINIQYKFDQAVNR